MVDDGRNSFILKDLNLKRKRKSALQGLGFEDWKSARTSFLRLEGRNQQGFSAIYPYLITTLGAAADPDRSLVNFERFLEGYGESLYSELLENPLQSRSWSLSSLPVLF